ncbi:MAG TPA: glycosyltransferase, partial [Fibrobacteria bacterium]|nr:glycosyltransferase [Fibrobacteria bacterium]
LDRETDFFTAPGSARETVRALAGDFRPDWILQVDDSLPLPHLGLEDLPVPKAWWAVDTHLHWEWHRHFAPAFDVVFCAQRNRIPVLGAHRRGVEWLPLSFPYAPEFLPWDRREHDVSFVGTLDPAFHGARIALLERLAALGRPVHVAQGSCGPVYRASRVVINQSANDDLNARFFEAIGFGALLITDRISHSLADIGEPGADFLVYEPGDAEDLHAKIRWALDHPEAAEAMARRANAKVAAGHLIGDRVRRVIRVLESAASGAPPRGRMLAHLAAAHEHLSRLTLPEPLVGFFASEARRLALASLEAAPGGPYASMTLAQLDLERGAYAEALGRLQAAGGGEGEAGDSGEAYRRRYLFLMALLQAHCGRLAEARRTVVAGLRDFPGDGDLVRLAAALGP